MSFYYSLLFPAAYFLAAATLLVHYWVDKFCLLRVWKPAPKLGFGIGRISRDYFWYVDETGSLSRCLLAGIDCIPVSRSSNLSYSFPHFTLFFAGGKKENGFDRLCDEEQLQLCKFSLR